MFPTATYVMGALRPSYAYIIEGWADIIKVLDAQHGMLNA